MSKSNIKIILFIVAVAILGLTYMYVFKDNMDSADSIQSEVDTLQTRYDELMASGNLSYVHQGRRERSGKFTVRR